MYLILRFRAAKITQLARAAEEARRYTSAMTDGRETERSGALADAIYHRLIELVLSNELPADSRVNLYQVARHLDVSATPVREALSRLDDEGLVVRSPLKGYRTTPVLDRKELDDLYELRLLLEPAAARAAAVNGSDEALDALLSEAMTFSRAPSGADIGDYASFCRHDGRLHGMIAHASGNGAIARALARTHFHLHAFRLGYEASAGQSTLDEHVRVAAAVARRDGDAAADAMRAHLIASRDRLLPLARTGTDPNRGQVDSRDVSDPPPAAPPATTPAR